MARPSVVMVNPKTLDLVGLYVDPRQHDFQIGIVGEHACVGSAYTDNGDVWERARRERKRYVRIHSPGGCTVVRSSLGGLRGVNPAYKGKGFGLLLYVGAAIAAATLDDKVAGVFSKSGTRSAQADALWRSLVDNDVAGEHDDEDGDERVESEEHCAPVRDHETSDGGYIVDDEVCGRVDVEYRDYATINTITAEDAVAKEFVLWADGWEKDEDEMPPADLLARIRASSRGAAEGVISFLREHYTESLALAFARRPDVLELFGQEHLPLSGPGRRAGLPPVSRRTRDLVDMFRNAP